MGQTNDTNESTAFADEISDVPAPIGATAGAIHARITIERDRLQGEETIEAQLTIERKRLLVEGTDADIDEVERRIDTSRGAQVRILERVDLLRAQLIAANEQSESERLDAVAARGNRAREHGESLIREYAELAPKLVAIMERLAAADQIVEETNNILHRAKRDSDMVDSPNAIRRRPARRWKETVRKMVGPRDPGHPAYGQEFTRTSNTASVQKVYVGSVAYDQFVEADVEVEMYDPGDRPQPLQDKVALPAVGPAPPNSGLLPLWDGEHHGRRGIVSDTVIAEVRERIDRDPEPIGQPSNRRRKTTDI
jgi:hypothetical protein